MKAINKRQVAEKCGGKALCTIDRWANDPRYAHLNFPKPFRIGDNSAVWDEHEIDAWLAERAATRETEAA